MSEGTVEQRAALRDLVNRSTKGERIAALMLTDALLNTDAIYTLAEMIEEHLAGGGMLVAATHVPLNLGRARTLRPEGRPD